MFNPYHIIRRVTQRKWPELMIRPEPALPANADYAEGLVALAAALWRDSPANLAAIGRALDDIERACPPAVSPSPQRVALDRLADRITGRPARTAPPTEAEIAALERLAAVLAHPRQLARLWRATKEVQP